MKITCGARTLLAKTCAICMELKDAVAFSPMKGGFRQSYCHSCKNKHGQPLNQAKQEKSLRAATSHRQPWTVSDITKLSEMVSDGLTAPVMAAVLGRTVGATYTMMNKLKERDEIALQDHSAAGHSGRSSQEPGPIPRRG